MIDKKRVEINIVKKEGKWLKISMIYLTKIFIVLKILSPELFFFPVLSLSLSCFVSIGTKLSNE